MHPVRFPGRSWRYAGMVYAIDMMAICGRFEIAPRVFLGTETAETTGRCGDRPNEPAESGGERRDDGDMSEAAGNVASVSRARRRA